MTATREFQALVHDTLAEVAHRTSVSADVADRLLTNTRQHATTAPVLPRRRTWLAPVAAAAAVLVAVIATLVLIDHRDRSQPAISPGLSNRSTPTPIPSTSTGSAHNQSRSSPPTVNPSQTNSAATGANTPWTANSLIITPTSLGAVRNGMTLTQAENAAELPFPGRGDGAYYPLFTSTDAPHLYIRPNGDSHFPACIGAEGDGKGRPTISTADGFRLGDTVTELKAIYGQQLKYLPPPQGGGLSPRAGYVLKKPSGTLIFAVDPTTNTIDEIAGSIHPLTPSSCPG